MTAQSRIRRLHSELDDHASSIGLRYIAQRLGRRNDYGVPRLIRYVTLLIGDFGFPPPWPTLVHRRGEGDELVTAVVKDSRWSRAAVDAWLEDYLPPANAEALDARAAAAAAADMDASATTLQLVGAGR